MLDALVAEARLRWGLDLAAGLQVIAAEHLAGTPLEPSRPALIVPAAILRIDPAAVDGLAAQVLPGRHAHGNDPVATLMRLYPADHPVGRFGSAEGLTIGELTGEALEAPLYLGPVAPELAFPS